MKLKNFKWVQLRTRYNQGKRWGLKGFPFFYSVVNEIIIGRYSNNNGNNTDIRVTQQNTTATIAKLAEKVLAMEDVNEVRRLPYAEKWWIAVPNHEQPLKILKRHARRFLRLQAESLKTWSVGILSDQVNCNFNAWTQWIADGVSKEEAEKIYHEELNRNIAGRSVFMVQN